MTRKAVAVIELKSTKTKDLKSITEQAFNYKNNQPECKYVITSNFQKLRFYIDYAHEYEEFDLFNLQKEDFELLYLLLNANSIFSDLPLKLKEETKFHEQQVSDKLYKDYSVFKNKLFENLIKNNPDNDKLTLFNKSQKLLDRFLFILFAEDSGLLPPNSISRIIDTFHKLTELDAYKPIYDIYKQYFGYMNIGRKGKTNADNIPAYNGGLFYTDELLDNLIIDDKILIDDLLKLSEYDFNTEVDVNILGHIFEHSLSEIEEITAEINAEEINAGEHAPPHISKRKKDGVFYTPKYITQYIVENTIGTLCKEKREELEIEEIEFDGSYRNKKAKEHAPSLSAKGKKLYKQLNDYKDWLLSLKIVDPACGSGAFLNQALNFLIEEHKNIDDIIAELTSTALRLFDTDKAILENNLYGVDINEESVEIAKLSLWLRTAQKGRKLSGLNDNIKCGNSLIDDPEVAGKKAFDWNKEFPQIFKKKEKKAWHITTATHNSRYSQRMYDNYVKRGEPVWLSEEEELIVTEKIAEIVKEDRLNILAYNICGDHLHLVLVCEKDEVPKIMQKIKSMSARTCNIAMGRTIPVDTNSNVQEHAEEDAEEHAPLHLHTSVRKAVAHTGEHAPQQSRGATQTHLWTQTSGKKEVLSEQQLSNTINYIHTNRQKHELPKNKELEKIINEMTCSAEHAFRTEYDGGFDVVIGNPPYVDIKALDTDLVKGLFKYYKTTENRINLYSIFIEKAYELVKAKGFVSFINPNSILVNLSYKKIRELLINEITKIIKLPDDVFVDAKVETIIFEFRKHNSIETVDIIVYSKSEKINFVDNSRINIIDKSVWKKDKNLNYNIFLSLSDINLLDKIKQISTDELGNIADFSLGITPYDKYQGHSQETIKSRAFHSNEKIDTSYKPLIAGENILRFNVTNQIREYIKYGDWLGAMREEKYFTEPRIIVRQIVSGKPPRIYAGFTDESLYFTQIGFSVIPKNKESVKFILSLMNSKLITYYHKYKFLDIEKDLFQKILIANCKQFPIVIISNERQQPFIENVDKILELTKLLQVKKDKFLNRINDNFEIGKISNKLEVFYNYDFKTFVTELKKQKIKLSLVQQDEWEEYFNSYKNEINKLQDEINTTDKEIDQMVYELYGLSEAEIKIVEESA